MTKVRNLLAAAVIFAALSSSSVSHASSANGTRITTIMVLATQTAFIGFTSISGNACTAAGYYIDISTSKGKAVLSIATAALLSNVIVDATGNNTCTTPSGGFPGETLVTLNVHNQ